MLYDAISLSEAEYASSIQQSGVAGLNANYEHTRQIKARDYGS